MDRYRQQEMVPEIGSGGQQQISSAKVLVIGAGGLGTPLATYLAAAGTGTVGIADGDMVAITNLHRQFLFTEKEIGQCKATVLATKLKEQNPDVQIHAHTIMIDESNAAAVLNNYDIVCDCTDQVESRILIDKICGRQNKPLVYAAIKDWEGYVTVLHHKNKMALSHIFSSEELRNHAALNCSLTGIINSTCGLAASLQASETLKIISGMPSELDGGILCFDARGPVFRLLKLHGEARK